MGLVPQREPGEIARIVRAVERAFGQGQKLPPLDLDPRQRIGRSRRGSVSAIFGGVLALAAVAGVAMTGWSGSRLAHPAAPAATAVQPFPGRPEPAATPTAAAPPAEPPHRRRAPVRRWARPRHIAHRAPVGPAAALRPETLERALARDRLRTREMNEAELRRTSS